VIADLYFSWPIGGLPPGLTVKSRPSSKNFMEKGNPKTSQQRYRTLFWLFLTLITLFRLFFAGKLGLGVDESHYLLYSRRLAWGYFDHPPMVAFLAALTTLWDDGVFFVRLGPVIC
jgi:hypothetical protein